MRSRIVLRNPFVVGRWVTGVNHYGRQRLTQYLLEIDNPATWVVGTRRMGKTSLLRQLEWLTQKQESDLVPLFWDLQGCESAADLAGELVFTLESVAERFAPFGIVPEALENKSAAIILRTLSRVLSRAGKRLFLLIDEAEVLIEIGQREPAILGQLRKAMQEPWQRTIITSTKLLSRLNELEGVGLTSPFLFGFHPVNLWSLDPVAAHDLVAQAQNPVALTVPMSQADDILVHTNRHPFLVQHLCHLLFESNADGTGYFRPITPEDTEPDHLLSGFFEIDFQHLTPTERRILLTIVRETVIADKALYASLGDLDPGRINNFLYGLVKLGYVRQVYGQWTAGNEFLRRWAQQNLARLETQTESLVSDANMEAMLTRGRTLEIAYLRAEAERLQEQLRILQDAAAANASPLSPQELARAIESQRQELSAVSREMKDVVNSDLIAKLSPVRA
ncbi:MAG: hypothetical protein KBG20_14155 [Caldilineaceae bacterium]|nr:hypothetical protein [Caldilineaceae bacterium]MBP8106727.1 hypothetical protein [Caldilineaceae bacterium]MBP8123402.1 hypothetical protein [Caldilineaceae bacterium]MBP9073445.1 hypothetical protein [Caldilineaceae bacterium]